MVGWRSVALAIVLLGVVIAPSAAFAQAGFYLTPSLSVGEVYDDNIFSDASGRQTDYISRFTPTVQAGYQSEPLTLLGRYSFDAERYENHPELTDAEVRRRASLELRYLPTRPLTLSFTGNYTQTQTPQDLNVLTGIDVERGRARSYSFNPSIAYQFDPRTSTTGGYTFTRSELAGETSTDAHIANWGLSRRITPLDTGTFGYTYRHFLFHDDSTPDGNSTTISHVGMLGWTHDFTPFTSMTLQGGPRYTERERSVDPEVSASITHKLQRGALSFTYARSQNTNIGQAGTVSTESFAASVTYQPLQFLHVNAAPGYIRSTRDGSETKVYRLNLGASYQITEWLSLVSSYQYSFQRGVLGSQSGTTSGSDEDILHNIVSLRLVATYPFRVY